MKAGYSRPSELSSKAIGFKINLGEHQLNHKQCILYALGIGFSQDPGNTEDLEYTYEQNPVFQKQSFFYQVFPTITSILGQQSTSIDIIHLNPNLPTIDIHTILHGEQRLYMVHHQIDINATYRIQEETIDAVDKGQHKGAVLVQKISAFKLDQQGNQDLAYFIYRTGFARALGGSGYKGVGLLKTMPQFPKRRADHVLKETTFPSQAILYRLSSGPNPIHIDPQTAKRGGFQRPILHGLATYGVVCRGIIKNLLKNKPERMSSMEVRFTGHVFGGQGLQIKVWVQGQRLFFEGMNERRVKAVIGVITVRPEPHL